MSFIFSTSANGRQVRVVSDGDDDENPTFVLTVDGALYTGFTSQVTALAAARRIIAGASS